ncbi:AAA family ATPase [Gordonia bronchialis]|uniref:AAA family ATPase n=1 Tax=Gordonia bronchialis TaxID=2054 RepID=UPI001CBCFB31|nr:AAA family ATPase [Gordonia bronchialis]UAK39660.1 AAA family ATPase [Gordonia bronchialis]
MSRAAKRQHGNRPRTEIAANMQRTERQNARDYQDQQVNEARQTLERRLAERGADDPTTTADTPGVDHAGPDDIPLPEEPVAEDGGPSEHGPRRSMRTSLADRLLTLSSLGELRTPTPLVGGLLYRGTLAQLAGPAGSYKSFLAIAVACSVAAGTDLDGQRIGEPEHVIYVAAEGAAGLRARILAWCEHHGIDPRVLEPTLHILPVPVQLGNRSTDVTQTAEAAQQLPAALVILDTRSKCTIGLEENSNTDQASAVAAAEQISEAGATVLVIHHTGRVGNNPRGATAWDGGVWSDLRIKEGKDFAVTVRCEKHKDAPSGCSHGYQLVDQQVSEAAMPHSSENARSTLVCVSRGGATRGPVSKSESLIVEALCETPGVTAGHLTEATGIPRATVYKRLNALVENGNVVKSGDRYSLTSSAVAQRKVS